MKLKPILIIFAVLVSMFAIQTANAGPINHYFAFVFDDNSKDFFFSEIYERDLMKYKAPETTNDYKDFVDYVKGSHTFYCDGCYSAAIYRSKTHAEAEAAMANMEKTFKSKGYSIHYKSWTP